jgi:hypothetical protein
MFRRLAFVAVFVAASVLAGGALFADMPKPAPEGKAKNAAFERLKKLTGTWTGKADHGGQLADVTVLYKVTAAGSTVIETLFAGTDHEMITMYTLDGDKLMLTHYCSAGNQPRMKAEKSDDPKKIAFKFVDGANLNPAEDTHMHEGTIEWLDDEHIKAEWVGYHKGKPIGAAKFDLRRQKAK